MDFAIDFESVQTNTQDRFQYTPVTFLSTKIQSIRPQIKNHEIHQKSQFERNLRGRKSNLENKMCSHKALNPSTSRTQEHHESTRNSSIQKPKGFKCSSYYKLEAKGRGKEKIKRGSKAPTKINSLMTLAYPRRQPTTLSYLLRQPSIITKLPLL